MRYPSIYLHLHSNTPGTKTVHPGSVPLRTVKTLVGWATGERLTDRLLKPSLVTFSPLLKSGVFGRPRCTHRCFGTRSDPAVRVPDRLSSRTVGPRTSSATSGLLPRSQAFLGQVPPGAEFVVPTTIPIGTRGKAAGLRSEGNTICAFQHAMALAV